MAQIIAHKSGYTLGHSIRVSMVFYQKTKNRSFLEWLNSRLVVGYLRDRPDGMSEYTIISQETLRLLLKELLPYLRLKQRQAILALEVLDAVLDRSAKLTGSEFLALAERIDEFFELNYSKKRTRTSATVREALLQSGLLDPVETDPQA